MSFSKTSCLLTLLLIGVTATYGSIGPTSGKNPSTLTGSVFDACSDKGLGDVEVQIVHKTSGENSVVTDSKGNFKFSNLPPGEVTITLKKKGYKTYKKKGIIIKEGSITKLNVDFMPENAEEVEEYLHSPLTPLTIHS